MILSFLLGVGVLVLLGVAFLVLTTVCRESSQIPGNFLIFAPIISAVALGCTVGLAAALGVLAPIIIVSVLFGRELLKQLKDG